MADYRPGLFYLHTPVPVTGNEWCGSETAGTWGEKIGVWLACPGYDLLACHNPS